MEIINKVANSKLEIFDLEDYYVSGIRTQIDICQWLSDGYLLREKDFREKLKNHDWMQYKDQYIAIYCSNNAIIPAWASILVTIYCTPFAEKIVYGNLIDLETSLYQTILTTINYSIYENKHLILKGCSKKPVPESAFILAIQYLQPYAFSIMYGEACSAVPLFKRKNKNNM